MVQIIPENRKQTFTERLNQNLPQVVEGIGEFAGNINKGMQSREENRLQQEKDKISREHDLEKIRLTSELAGGREREKYQRETEEKKKKLSGEMKEKRAPFEGALGAIEEMKQLRKKGNLGVYSRGRGIFSGETRKDRASYETLGNSLISFASRIPIRNKAEFETLTGMLNDPNITDEAASGVLEAMENIIRSSLDAFENGDDESPRSSQSMKITDFDL